RSSALSEYALLFGAGYNLRTDTFYFIYFFTTFFHMAHVLIGMVILLVVARRYRTGQYPNADKARMAGESAASYWHMVDLVWLVLFLLLYVLPCGVKIKSHAIEIDLAGLFMLTIAGWLTGHNL